MRLSILILLCWPFFLAVSAQPLPQFIQTQSENASLATRSFYNGLASYGEQFAVCFSNTDETVADELPQVYLYDETGEIITDTIFHAGVGGILSGAASSPDLTQFWFFGTTNAPPESGQHSDLGIIQGGEGEISYGALDLGISESFLAGAATNQHLFAITEQRNGIGLFQGRQLLKITPDFDLVDSISLPEQPDVSINYVLADESENFALIVYTNFSEAIVVGVDLTSRTVTEISLPDFQDCAGQERLVDNGGLINEEDDVFYLLTSCGRVIAIRPDALEVLALDGGTSSPLAEGNFARFLFSPEGPAAENFLILSGLEYRRLALEDNVLTEFEFGPYGFEGYDYLKNTINTNGIIFTRGDAAIGGFSTVVPDTVGNWQLNSADPILQDFNVETGSNFINPGRAGDNLYVVKQIDGQGSEEALQIMNPETGALIAALPVAGNRGLSQVQALADGNFALLKSTFNPSDGSNDFEIETYTPQGVSIGQLASWNQQSGFDGGLFRELIQAPNGDLLTMTRSIVFFPDFGAVANIRRQDQNGAEIFSVTLPDSLTQNLAQPVLVSDAEGNTYYFASKLPGGYTIVSLDPTGGLRYINSFDSELDFGFNRYRLSINASGQLFVIGVAANNSIQAYLAEIDPESGGQISFEFLAPEFNSSSLYGGFIPGTDSLVLFHGYLIEDDEDESEPLVSRLLVFDENRTLVYSQELLKTSFQDRLTVNDVAVSTNHIYITGARREAQLDDDFGTILGVDFSQLTEVLDVDDFAGHAQLKVFPNPSSDQFNLSWNAQGSGNFVLEMINVAGQTVQSQEGRITTGQINTIAVDVSSLPKGAYYLRLVTPTGTTVQPIQKQ